MSRKAKEHFDRVDGERERAQLARRLSQAQELLQRFWDHAEEDVVGFWTIGPCFRSEVEQFLFDDENQ